MTVHDDGQSTMVDSLYGLETKVPPPLVALVIAAAMWLVTSVTPVVGSMYVDYKQRVRRWL